MHKISIRKINIIHKLNELIILFKISYLGCPTKAIKRLTLDCSLSLAIGIRSTCGETQPIHINGSI